MIFFFESRTILFCAISHVLFWYFCQKLSEEKQSLLVIGIKKSLNLSMQLHFMIFKLILKHQNSQFQP
jgi:hypothetical protein